MAVERKTGKKIVSVRNSQANDLISSLFVWLQDFANLLSNRAVAYLNVDVAVKGITLTFEHHLLVALVEYNDLKFSPLVSSIIHSSTHPFHYLSPSLDSVPFDGILNYLFGDERPRILVTKKPTNILELIHIDETKDSK